MKTQIISHTAMKAIGVGRKEHWRFRVIGQGELPTEPSYKDQWWFMPTTDPTHGKDRLDALRRAGVRFKGIVVAHEAPRMLSAPKPEPTPQPEFQTTSSIPAAEIGASLANGLAMGLLLLVSVVFQAMLLDPALIVVLEDGTWLEVVTWYE